MSAHPNPSIPLFVAAAYDAMVEEHLKAGTALGPFIQTPEFRERWMKAEHVENERRESLMKDHQNEAGTTSVCRCGHVGYSTSGYLLHLYDVVEDDHMRRTGCDDR
jgi:hypothetical protein